MDHDPMFLHTPADAYVPSRRRFLKGVFGGLALAAAGLPGATAGHPVDAFRTLARRRPATDEGYWRLVKDQFGLKQNLILMNAANLCPAPFPVVDAVINQTRDIDGDASFPNRGKLQALRESAPSGSGMMRRWSRCRVPWPSIRPSAGKGSRNA